ncbi:MAG TPA: AAA family ATPase [Planctomycetota bacterium]|nr:AAA family ATPase [Planctomycetota bacterium]
MSAVEWLAELAVPACFPHAPKHVEIVQTHLSVVCLAGDLVYKLKKAITLPFVDFATLSARRNTCRDEVRLNRRLCPDTYLGTAALRRRDGGLRFAATGDDDGRDDLDVAVVMRRLPAERMLDELVRRAQVSTAEIEGLARHMARFHARADRGPEVLAAGDPDQLAAFAAANFTELQAMPGHGLPEDLLARLADATADDFARLLPALRARATAGRVVDGHGDLHARNICMTAPPTVYDCIEFKAAFRCGDVATENAFLAMDLRHRGAPGLAAAYVRAYAAASGDAEMAALLPVLCCYRAMVRAKVATLAAADAELPAADRDGARHSAHRHLLLAAAYAIEARGPCWVVICGPPASGKSRLCEAIAEAAHWRHFHTDLVRKELAGIPPTGRARAEHYTAEFSRRTYAEMCARAAAATRGGDTVVMLDGNYPTPGHRAEAAAAAHAAGARLVTAFVDVDAATAAARAARRQHDPDNVSDAGPEQLAALRLRFVPPTAAEGTRLLHLDGATAPTGLAAELLSRMLAPRGA